MPKERAENLPAELTSFVGRRRELAEVRRLLSAARMVTLTGVGGVGKTRLALRAAAAARRAYPDGVWLVDLAPVVTGKVLVATVVGALGLQGRSDLGALCRYLSNKRLLIVLDNCEHMLTDCAVLVTKLLGCAPGVQVLATSRQTLGVEGERVLNVPPLSMPDDACALPGHAALRYEAVELFADRAAAVLPDFTVDDANVTAVLALCRWLDGIPLAIELAATRMRALSVHQIVDRLGDRFRMLTAGDPTALPRQKTLRAMIDWSYELCSAEERVLWQRSSIFSGGFVLAAAEAVCSGDGIAPDRMPDVVIGLVDKSILVRREQEAGTRYVMLETLRQYGRERLVETGQEVPARRRHCDWCRGLAAQLEAEWFGPSQLEWIRRIRDEQANVCAALEFCVSDAGAADSALEIASAMWSLRLSWSSLRDGHHWLELALAHATAPTSARAKALWVDAWILLLCGDPDGAAPLLAESRALTERLDDASQIAGMTQICGFAALVAGDFATAMSLLEDARARHHVVGDRGRAWISLFQLAMAAVFSRDPRSAELCAENLRMCRRADALWSTSYALWLTGLDRWLGGDAETATTMVQDALRLKPALNDHLGIAQCIEVLAWIANGAEQDRRAAELLGAASSVWQSIGTSLSGLGHLSGHHDRCEARLRRRLGEAEFVAAHARGSGLGIEHAVLHALGDSPPAETAQRPGEEGVAAVLTRREREVAELVSRGLSNKDIADRLVIAPRTAEGHVERVLRKLGFNSRAQIAATWGGRQRR